jgi:hypothetical protein
MGYDDGECVQCRLEHGGNRIAINRYNLCMGCLHEYTKTSTRMDGRLMAVLQDNMNLYTVCSVCKCDSSIVFNVSVCEDHYRESK